MVLLDIVIKPIKTKILPILTKVKKFFSIKFIQKQVLTRIRTIITGLLDFNPRDKSDYYVVRQWQIGKKLSWLVMATLGILCVCYLYLTNPFSGFGGGMRSYRYNSMALRFVSGEAAILADSGYVAYQGDVEGGKVTGKGDLFNKDSALVYEGDFVDNQFQGMGKLYHPNQNVKYEGEFAENLFEGQGVLYRENGSKEYEGAFSRSMKHGEGILYNTSGNQAYVGSFWMDYVEYLPLVGISTTEVGEKYTGEHVIYSYQNESFVYLKDINAAYYLNSEQNRLDEEFKTDGIYVLMDTIQMGDEKLSDIYGLKEYFGEPVYEGNTELLFQEAVALSLYGKVELNVSQELEDAVWVESYDKNYLAYLYTFEKDGVLYSFYCPDRTGSFYFYLMELMGG